MEEKPIPNPYKGLVVEYVLKTGRIGETRAAIVTNTWPSSRDAPHLVNGTVFLDQPDDREFPEMEKFFTSAHYDGSAAPEPGTWHFIGPTDPPDPG